MEPINLDLFSYDEWVRFVFDHPVVSGRREWYWEDKWAFEYNDVHKQVEYLVTLFSKPRFLMKHYSDKKMEQGMWFFFLDKN